MTNDKSLTLKQIADARLRALKISSAVIARQQRRIHELEASLDALQLIVGEYSKLSMNQEQEE